MRHLKLFYANKSIRYKLLLNFILIILLIVTALGFLNANKMSKTLENITNNHTLQIIKQVKNNIEFYIKDMENIIAYISKNRDLNEYITLHNQDNIKKNYYKEKIKELLKIYSDEHPEISGILFADEDGNIISNDMMKITRNSLTWEIWYKKAIKCPEHIHLFSKPIGRNVMSIFPHYRADDVVSIVKAVKDVNGRTRGVLLIDMKLKVMEDTISNNVLGKNGFLYIADTNGEIVYTPVNPVVYRIKSKWLDKNKANIIKTVGKDKLQIMYEHSKYTDWNFIGVFSLNSTLKIIKEIIFYTVIYACIILIIASIITYFYTNSISKPLRKLQDLMKKAENGQLDVRFEAKYNDEIGQLGNSFNNMIESIKNLINLVCIEQKKKKEAELKAFQAQIKPHFLYNTLDTINWMAQEYEADDISEIIIALTNLFRISLSKGKEIIRVEEELKHVQSYLTIQMARYEDKFTYEINCDSKLLNNKVIKLILQPIIENSIYHGFKLKRGKCKIIIEVKKIDNKLCFLVIDDGVGIKEDKLKEINDILNGKVKNTNQYGIGIFNVNERIKLSFGDEYGIKIYSKLNEGTIVQIWHPIIVK